MEMRSVRSIYGEPLKDICRNSDVRQRCGLKEEVVTRVERGMLRWFGHLERMNESRLIKPIYRANMCDGKLMKLKQEVEKKQPELINRKGEVFYHDNARPNTSLANQRNIERVWLRSVNASST
ncbi:hypothetical protein EVAR_3717_1 [Eumeta japonica]|uniref:Histone-lysine N-methyltransferase SETMAR n=1 Tax=Eumeta variegata TaxID=151549 RepID=A0A4C1SS61_EUMVA|nr:hypothetical protein EVAR_3717_1 [Eumeta japonica]